MKKIKFIILFVFLITLLQANILIDLYHYNYGIIDRTVLVFDSKPEYSIFKRDDVIQLNIEKCKKNITLNNSQVKNNNTINGFQFKSTKTDVIVLIMINTAIQNLNKYKYDFDLISIKGSVYKLVLDIFSTKNPQTNSEIQSFVNFYDATGRKNKADEYRYLLKHGKLKSAIDVTKVSKTKDAAAQQRNAGATTAQQKKEKENLSFLQKIFSRFDNTNLLLFTSIFVGVIALTLLIIMIINLSRKKATSQEVSFDEKFRNMNDFGDKDFQKEMIAKLIADDWGKKEIAHELNLTNERINELT